MFYSIIFTFGPKSEEAAASSASMVVVMPLNTGGGTLAQLIN